MTAHVLRPERVCAAAVVLGGALVVVFPHYARSIVHLVIGTVPVAVGLHLLASRVPPTRWLSPFKWMSPFASPASHGPTSRARNELALIRAWLSGWRQRVPGAPPLPPATLTLLKPLIGRGLELDPHETPTYGPAPGWSSWLRRLTGSAESEGPSAGGTGGSAWDVAAARARAEALEAARGRVSPLTWAVLTAVPRTGFRWLVRIPPDHQAVAQTVGEILDDLDRLNDRAGARPGPSPDTPSDALSNAETSNTSHPGAS